MPAWSQQAKYVFYFIGDGMGLNQVVATQYYLRSCQGELGITPLGFAQFPYTGIATTGCAFATCAGFLCHGMKYAYPGAK